MDVPRNVRFTKTHEWIREEDGKAVIGVTDFAQQQLADLTFVELPSLGDTVHQDDEVAVVESVKAASDIYAPISGKITRVNDALIERPEKINQDPYGEGWLFEVEPTDPAELQRLLSADEYEQLLPDTA